MSDTPLTDTVAHRPGFFANANCELVRADFARELERERDEWKADSERLKAREVALTDRQVHVQMALKKFNFDFQPGEGLPELVARVASMASAYRARDNIGMSRERFHQLCKDGERLSLLEWLGESAFFPGWDDNGFWFAKVNERRVIGTTLRQFCDAAIAAKNSGAINPQTSNYMMPTKPTEDADAQPPNIELNHAH